MANSKDESKGLIQEVLILKYCIFCPLHYFISTQ